VAFRWAPRCAAKRNATVGVSCRPHNQPRPPAWRRYCQVASSILGPPHLRTNRTSANLLRTPRPRHPPTLAERRYVRSSTQTLCHLTLSGLTSPVSRSTADERRTHRGNLLYFCHARPVYRHVDLITLPCGEHPSDRLPWPAHDHTVPLAVDRLPTAGVISRRYPPSPPYAGVVGRSDA
jgi:hypothetical protein